MYRTDLDSRHKSGAMLGVAAIHVALGLALLHMSGTVDLASTQDALKIFEVTEAPPPVVEPPPPPQVQQPREQPREAEGAAAPENIRSQATPIVDPKPIVELPLQPSVAVSETPREGTDSTQGASDRPGPGTGAGGVGTGTGSGGSGNGTGGGGGGAVVSPGLIRGITNRDYPRAVQREWPRGGRIFVRLRIEPDGRPSQCDVMRSFGNPAADQLTCRLIVERGAFRPARDASGTPVAAWFGYVQSDSRL